MTGRATAAYIGLGGNLGEVAATLREAIAALDALPQTTVAACSRFYRTPAWGIADQPPFLNAVVKVSTALDAQALLRALLDIERAAGRVRSDDPDKRWGPRALDLDLLVFGEARIDRPGLHVPHPHLHERAFVLVPLAEIAPDLDVPGLGRVAELLARVDAAGIQAIP